MTRAPYISPQPTAPGGQSEPGGIQQITKTPGFYLGVLGIPFIVLVVVIGSVLIRRWQVHVKNNGSDDAEKKAEGDGGKMK